ncbi:MAG: C40 family peptidase [Romboutsia sp.]|nr:C40 family peptidase [Romboutsia sp.]
MIKLICQKVNGEKLDLTNLLINVTWSGDYKSCARKLEFSLVSSSYDINIPKVDIPLMSVISFYEDDNELFKGFVYEREKSSDNSMNFLCYDYCAKLNDIKVSKNIKNQTASTIYNNFLTEYGLNKGDIVSASTNISKVFLGVTAYDMIMTAYTEEAKNTGKKYMLYSKGNKFYASEKGIIKLKLSFEEGKNILSSSFKESVSNMVNKVLIVDENGNKVSEVKNDEWLKTYGLFQDVYKQQESKDSNAEAKAMLKDIEQTCSLTGFGDTTCVTGYGVQVKDTYTGLVGLFYIDSDTHTWEGGNYTIDLELNFKNIMNEIEAGQDEKEETASNNSNSSDTVTTVTGGKEVDAEYTAYYPANNSMQGGLYDAMGNKLDPSKLTCAAPKDVAFGTKIQVKGTGTNRDGLVYKVTDRGGAIKVENGVYKIDLLMSTKEECLKFGRRKGKAIIGVETTTIDKTPTASGTGAKLVELAKSKLGCKYVWGATGPNTFDCSGLTSWCHKQLGISIPRTSLAQSKSGKTVSKSDLQPGDLIFWKTTSAEVGHVGMYVGNGQFIHAPNKSKPVKYDSLSSSYYSSRYVRARRYY